MASLLKMVELLELSDEISPLCSKAPNEAIERALRNAAKMLFEQSLIWRYDADPVPIRSGKSTYPVPLPTHGLVWRVPAASYLAPGAAQASRVPIYSRSEQQLQGHFSQGVDYRNRFTWFGGPSDWRTATGSPRFYTHKDTAEDVRLAPIPVDADEAGSLYLDVAATMPRGGTKIPSWIADRYYRTLVGGALASLFGMADEAWSDPARSMAYGEAFTLAVEEVTAHTISSHTTTEQAVAPRFSLDG